jgi:hypothetical protein
MSSASFWKNVFVSRFVGCVMVVPHVLLLCIVLRGLSLLFCCFSSFIMSIVHSWDFIDVALTRRGNNKSFGGIPFGKGGTAPK